MVRVVLKENILITQFPFLALSHSFLFMLLGCLLLFSQAQQPLLNGLQLIIIRAESLF